MSSLLPEKTAFSFRCGD